jgi:hypothetical protein
MSGTAGRGPLPAAGSGATVAPPPTASGGRSGGAAAIGGGVGVTAGYVAPPPVAGVAGTTIPPTSMPMAGGAASNGLPPFDAGSDPNRNHVVAGQLCSRLAVIQCAAEQHCCNNPGRTASQCQTQSVSDCMTEPSIDQLAAVKSTGFDPTITAMVFDELERRSAECDVGLAEWSVGPSGVRTILQGTIGANASCKPTGDINNKVNQGAALASCTNSETMGCLPMSLLGGWTCAPKSGADGKCLTDDNCMTGLFCCNPAMTPFGKCAERKDVGASCKSATECTSLICKNGSCVAADQQSAFCLK